MIRWAREALLSKMYPQCALRILGQASDCFLVQILSKKGHGCIPDNIFIPLERICWNPSSGKVVSIEQTEPLAVDTVPREIVFQHPRDNPLGRRSQGDLHRDFFFARQRCQIAGDGCPVDEHRLFAGAADMDRIFGAAETADDLVFVPVIGNAGPDP